MTNQATTQPEPEPEAKPIALLLTLPEVQAVANALGAQPYVQVAGLITKISDQVNGQVTAVHDPDCDNADQVADATATEPPAAAVAAD